MYGQEQMMAKESIGLASRSPQSTEEWKAQAEARQFVEIIHYALLKEIEKENFADYVAPVYRQKLLALADKLR